MSEPRRVLHVIPSIGLADGGPPWVLAGLADAAVAAGMTVAVLSIDGDSGARQAFDDHVEALLLRERGQALARRLEPEVARTDIVHAHSVYTATTTMALRAAQLAGKPVVLTAHGALMMGAMRPWQVWKRIWVLVRLRRYAGARPLFHALTQLELQRSAWAGLRARVHAPLWRLRSGSSAPPATRYGDYVLALGRIHPIKRIETVLWALATVDGLRLVVAGAGERAYEDRLRQLADKLGVAKRVDWRGRVTGEDKVALLREARCLVQASRLESFGVAVLEAMATGVPVAVSDGVAAAEWVRASRAGVVVDGGPSAWAAALQSVASEPQRWDGMADRATRWAAALPSREEQGAELAALYRSLAA